MSSKIKWSCSCGWHGQPDDLRKTGCLTLGDEWWVCPSCGQEAAKMERIEEHSVVVLDGELRVERPPYDTPLDCSCGCDPNKSWIPPLVGGVSSPGAGASLHALYSLLERLNGKQIKVTVEWGENA